MRGGSIFKALVEAPPDPILGTAIAFKKDLSTRKVNLGIGAYRTDEGEPYVFPVVRRIQASLIAKNLDKEYLPIDGLPELKVPTQRLLFGEQCEAIHQKRIASSQVLSGTGGLRVIGEFLKDQVPQIQTAMISRPTWTNHINIFKASGFRVKEYAYWHKLRRDLDFENLLSDLKAVEDQSLVVFHACAHNPTDLTMDQWREVLGIVIEKNHIPLFDVAYQGFASGNLEQDAFAIRLFQKAGLEMFVSQSFAKNMGLYGERIGMLHVVCESEERANVVLSQLKPIMRRMYSSPPIWGARIASEILNVPDNNEAWKEELKAVAERILGVRQKLKEGLLSKGTPGSWNHITQQIGMFSYTGLNPEQCDRMISKWHIYMLRSGRISLAGLNPSNLNYVIDAIDDCVRNKEISNL